MKDFLKSFERSTIVGSLIMIAAGVLLIVWPVKMLNSIVMIIGVGLIVNAIAHLYFYFSEPPAMRAYSFALVTGFLSLMAGIILYVYRGKVTSVIPWIIGVWILVKGVMKVQMGVKATDFGERRGGWVLIGGLLNIALGVLMILYPFDAMVSMTMLAGWMLVLTEVFDLAESIIMTRRMNGTRYY